MLGLLPREHDNLEGPQGGATSAKACAKGDVSADPRTPANSDLIPRCSHCLPRKEMYFKPCLCLSVLTLSGWV